MPRTTGDTGGTPKKVPPKNDQRAVVYGSHPNSVYPEDRKPKRLQQSPLQESKADRSKVFKTDDHELSGGHGWLQDTYDNITGRRGNTRYDITRGKKHESFEAVNDSYSRKLPTPTERKRAAIQQRKK